MIPKFLSKNHSGMLSVCILPEFEEYLATLPEDVFVIVKSAKEKQIRSNNQNRYLHGYLFKEIADFTGHSLEEIKEEMKFKFLKAYKRMKTKDGETDIEYIKPTSSLTTVELEQFCTEIRQWASFVLGLYLANPNEITDY